MTIDPCEQDRRIMRLQVTPEALLAMCTNSRPFTMRITSGCLPEDAKSVGVTHDFASNSFFIFVESAAFDVLPDGEVATLLPPVQFERIV
jgi:hypothetical protein